MQRSLLLLGLAVATALVACAPSETPSSASSAATVVDGVRVVENSAPVWGEGNGWRVSPEPVVTIGVDAGEEPYMLYRVGGVLRLDDGTIVVGNSGTGELRFFDEIGTFLHTAGRRGQGPGEFGEFSSIRLWQDPVGRILAVDAGNSRINAFGAEGDFLGSAKMEPMAEAPRVFMSGVFGDGTWMAYAARGGGSMRAEQPGRIIEYDYLYFRYDEGVGIAELVRSPSRPRYEHKWGDITHFPYIPLASEPLPLAAGEHFYLIRGSKPEIEVRDLDGDPTMTIRWSPDHLQRSEDVWNRYVEESLAGIVDEDYRARYAHYYAEEPPNPEFVPTYARMLADSNGNIWLERYRLPWNERHEWDVIGSDGRWLGTLEMPAGFVPHQITAEHVIGLHRDEMGVERVRVHRLQR